MLARTLDVRDAGEVAGLVTATIGRFGRIDVLVAAAGVGDGGRVDELAEDDWDRVVDVSLKGTFLCCRAVVPELRRAGGGAIVTFGSVLGRRVIPGIAPYGAAKAGVELLTRAMAVDYARDGIRVNCILPGSTDTPLMWAGVREEELPSVRSVVESEVPMGRIADPVEIARCVFFLASDEASFVTGASLIVDGGTSARIASTY
jgi:NAD(P)-dependent dehydrogenase (short-subunit alcohol dehydrogenase family)